MLTGAGLTFVAFLATGLVTGFVAFLATTLAGTFVSFFVAGLLAVFLAGSEVTGRGLGPGLDAARSAGTCVGSTTTMRFFLAQAAT